MEIEVLWHGDYRNLIEEYYTQNGTGYSKDYVQFVKLVGAAVSLDSVICLVATKTSMELVSVDKKGYLKTINKKPMNYNRNHAFLISDSISEGFMNIDLEIRNCNYDFQSKKLCCVIEDNRKAILDTFNDKEDMQNVNELIENVINIAKRDNFSKLM